MIGGNAGTTLLDAARLTAETPAPYPTPQSHDHACPKTPEQIEEMRARAPKRTSGGPPGISNLNEVVMTMAPAPYPMMVPAPYPTPNASCGTRGGGLCHLDGRRSNLIDTVKLMDPDAVASGWATPASHEAGGTPERFIERKELARESGSKLGISLTSLALQAQLTTAPRRWYEEQLDLPGVPAASGPAIGSDSPEIPPGGGAVRGYWAEDVEWIYCRPEPGHEDGRWRPARAGIEPLVAGIAADVGRTRTARLRGYGNSIVLPLAASFVGAVIDALVDASQALVGLASEPSCAVDGAVDATVADGAREEEDAA